MAFSSKSHTLQCNFPKNGNIIPLWMFGMLY